MSVTPYSLKDAPALIEAALPVQKLSAEVFKERMAGNGQTLTALGSYWKGRKPLILNRAVILGCLLPVIDLEKDLEVFELLMGMDPQSMRKRLKLKPGAALPNQTYRKWVEAAKRPEEFDEGLQSHIWDTVNAHLGTKAQSIPELVEQLGIMRYGHRPRVADTFSGSGQIPFEAARLGCEVYASDLNPIACMLTWGAFNIVGPSKEQRLALEEQQKQLVAKVRAEIDRLGVESDGRGWRGKVYLYCLEARCPQTGWMVPLMPSRVVSVTRAAIAELVPDPTNKRYDIVVRSGVSKEEMEAAASGTVRSDGRGQAPYMVHSVDGQEYRTNIATLRGDYTLPDGSTANRLRRWDKSDFMPQVGDIYGERLYAIQWIKDDGSTRPATEFRSVSAEDLEREATVQQYVAQHLEEWQQKGWIPDMRIEPGDKTDEPIRTRGWTYWHHLFNPRQLLLGALANQSHTAYSKVALCQFLNWNSRLSTWDRASRGGGGVKQAFMNQALNPLYDYGCRGLEYARGFLELSPKNFPFPNDLPTTIKALPAQLASTHSDIWITDPPYGDAVKYEEILDFFIAWLRKNPPAEFADWVWDSRRDLAIKGEDEGFRRGMVAAYRRMAELMPDNGMQVLMFTHQSGSIWADMANIVWAAGLRVSAAWYLVTETDSALRDGSYVKGTVLLVLRKRLGQEEITSDDLGWELKGEVERQVETLVGLNQRKNNQTENLFADADLQMAGYAAALRVLTKYSSIDGKDMTREALQPRTQGQKTLVDQMIDYAVSVANQALVPEGLERELWERLRPAERFYLKLLQQESLGRHALDNYQNFARAFGLREHRVLLAVAKANKARLKSAAELGSSEMNEASEFGNTVLRGVLYAMAQLTRDTDGELVLEQLSQNVPQYWAAGTRERVVELCTYLADKLAGLRSEEASAARVLSNLVRFQRV